LSTEHQLLAATRINIMALLPENIRLNLRVTEDALQYAAQCLQIPVLRSRLTSSSLKSYLIDTFVTLLHNSILRSSVSSGSYVLKTLT
jgi:hypothetical protein